ncbi:MAG: SLAC1 anion channel family protein [Bordetella sp.]|uniref:SLAC1 anion channel family protein n=1 Tax=Bordetella sp. TaxID=28081 RepID=UPI003F7B430E
MSQTATMPVRSLSTARPLERLPVNLFASVMGLSGLALAWRTVQTQFGVGNLPAAIASWLAIGAFLVMALGYLAKAVRHPAAVKAEFDHPIVGAFFGTVSISLLMLSAVVDPYSADLGKAVWVAGCVVTVSLGYVAFGKLLRGGVDAKHAVPAWLIPGVSTLDIAVTGSHMPMAWAGQFVLFATAIGAVLALVMFTLIGTRMIQHQPLGPSMTPSLMILIAPFEVGFLAYVNVVGTVDRFAALLFYFGLFMFLVVTPKILRPGVRFGATWWAIGFPVAALVNAALRYAAAYPTLPLRLLSMLLLAFLTVALGILTFRTVKDLCNGRLLSA